MVLRCSVVMQSLITQGVAMPKDRRSKDVFSGTVYERSKDGFREAGKILFQTDRGLAKVFNTVGEQLMNDVEELKRRYGGEIPESVQAEVVCVLRLKETL
jgi:hypothetical protein